MTRLLDRLRARSERTPPAGVGGWVPLRRRGHGLRRWLAAGCAAAATAVALGTLAPDPRPGVPVLVAARDVPAGAALQDGDLDVVRRPATEVPAQALTSTDAAVGRVVAAPLRAREVLTRSRLVGRSLLAARPAGDVMVPVRMADGAASALLTPGSRVDVLVAAPDQPAARTVARGATVLAVPGAASSGASTGGSTLLGGSAATDPGQGGLVLLAVPASTGNDLAQAAVVGQLSFLVR
ncbi:Flp pilus assembly protein CpaB [Angustibacter luteus]|uniref:Flp pilus assembly protein CpaB n=1 Tax=Angustibacter luteus TaxID=658456 RepID=A0ABW1JCY0_9ACTN